MANQASPNGTPPAAARPKRSKVPIIVGAVVVVAAVIAGGLWWYLRDDAPAKVNIDTAAESVTSVAGQTQASIDGTWNIDTTTGSFSYTTATGTFAGFRVNEDLSGVGSTTAVGRTNAVTGSMTIADKKITAAKFTVDLTAIKTDREMRDQRVQDTLDTSQFPDATFTLTQPITLPSNAQSGASITVKATGKLTIHGVTKTVAIPLQAKLKGSTVVVVGSIDLAFSDYGIETPSAPIVLSLDDHATMEFQLLLTK